MENGFSIPRTNKFPVGLRVLVVDDDPTWLKILEKMLRKCLYEVTTCFLARDALNLLRERRDGFDIVISDVNMPDMDGFKLLERVGLEMDLPVIMMSVDGETSRVMKGVQHGACDYLLKPVRMKELSNIWQHVFRKKIHEVKDTESHECMGNVQLMRNESDDFHGQHVLNGGNIGATKKRKDMENKKHDDQELVGHSASKKVRVVWSMDLHQKFIDAVTEIGFDKVGPKKILDLMNVPWLTRENVASHLQKFRIYLSKLQRQKEQEASFRGINQDAPSGNLSGGIEQQDFSSEILPGRFNLQDLIAIDLKNAANSSFGYTGNKISVDNMGPEVHEADLKGMNSFKPVTKPRNSLTADFQDHHKRGIRSQMDLAHSFKLLDQNFKHQQHESTLPTQTWNEIAKMQFKQSPNQELKPYPLLEDDYSPLLLSGPRHHFQVDIQNSVPSTDLRTTFPVCDNLNPVKIKPFSTQHRNNDDRDEFPGGCKINSIPYRTDGSHIVNRQAFEATPTISLGMKSNMVDQSCINNWETAHQKLRVSEQALAYSLERNLQFCLPQENGCTQSIGHQNLELSDNYNPELIAELPGCYDDLGFDCEMIRNSIDNPFVDQGLFIEQSNEFL